MAMAGSEEGTTAYEAYGAGTVAAEKCGVETNKKKALKRMIHTITAVS
jgi:hypothetical protein